MSKEARALLNELLLSGIDAAGFHCLTAPDEPEPDEPEPDEREPDEREPDEREPDEPQT
jgi:hypothetical protein